MPFKKGKNVEAAEDPYYKRLGQILPGQQVEEVAEIDEDGKVKARPKSPNRFELLYDARKAYNEKKEMKKYDVNKDRLKECSF